MSFTHITYEKVLSSPRERKEKRIRKCEKKGI